MIKFLDLHKQYLSIKSDIDKAIQSVISDSAYIRGKYVDEFENAFADYQSTEHCIGVANGTDALEIAIEALQLPKPSEIIIPGNSFIASAESVTRSGHKVVFCDVNQDDYTIDVDDVKKRINSNTSAIMAVHLYGHPCDMDSLSELAKHNSLKLIEDCAQAHGAEYKGRRVGAIGDIGAFSFYPGKNLGAYGDAGAITTNDSDLALKCRMIANHGRVDKYKHEFEGRNSRLDGLQAAILNVKLRSLPEWTNIRILLAENYITKLSEVESIRLPIKKTWAKHVYHLFVIRTQCPDKLRSSLLERQIPTGCHYSISLPCQEAYRYAKQFDEPMFVNYSSDSLISLPIGDHLEVKDIDHVCYNIIDILRLDSKTI